MRIAFFSARKFDRIFFEPIANENDVEMVWLDTPLNEQTAALASGCDGVCAFVNDDLGKSTLRKLKELGVGLVALRCAGFNNCDLEEAGNLQIRVVRVPQYSPHSVAEHTFALLLSLVRSTHRAFNRVREGNFELDGLLGFDLVGKSIGIIGAGRIGSQVATIANGFGMNVWLHDPFVANVNVPCQRVDLETIWNQADVISLHCPLTDQTQHLVDAAAISKMKNGVILLNTGRGGLIDTSAVITALKKGKIGGLGIDVYENEAALFFEDRSNAVLDDDLFARLLTFPNVMITGHQGFFTREALEAIARVTIQSVLDYKQGGELENEVRWSDAVKPTPVAVTD